MNSDPGLAVGETRRGARWCRELLRGRPEEGWVLEGVVGRGRAGQGCV